jgi:hypothetical protein
MEKIKQLEDSIDTQWRDDQLEKLSEQYGTLSQNL